MNDESDRPSTPSGDELGQVISECYTTIDSAEEHCIYLTDAQLEQLQGEPDQCSEQPGDRPSYMIRTQELRVTVGEGTPLELQGDVITGTITLTDDMVDAFVYVYQAFENGRWVNCVDVERTREWVEPRIQARRTDHYTLDGKIPVPCYNLLEWARWFEAIDRTVARAEVNGYRVSTVFLGLDHSSWCERGEPILFETMVFPDPPSGQVQFRYSSWDEAEEGHRVILNMVAGLKNLGACVGCRHYHGQAYNGVMFVCGMYPYGWEGEEKCPDRESSYE